MLLKKELDELIQFMADEGGRLGLSQSNIDHIRIATGATVSFVFPSHTSQLELIRLSTKKIVSFLPAFTEDERDDVGLAIDEACTNVITHSMGDSQKGNIKVVYKLDSDKLTIVIVDEGEKGQKFSLEDLSPVDKEEYLKTLTKGGLGIHIIKKIMDKVEYTVSPGESNCLTMVSMRNNSSVWVECSGAG